jgi:hypothetical protein
VTSSAAVAAAAASLASYFARYILRRSMKTIPIFFGWLSARSTEINYATNSITPRVLKASFVKKL